MPSIGRQFGSGNGVPRSAEALAALGVDEKGSKGSKGDRGSKGPDDEIVLSAAEQMEAEKSEDIWDRERMIAWAKTIGEDEHFHEDWINETIIIHSDGRIECKAQVLDLERTNVSEIPKGLQVKNLLLNGTQVKEIPAGLQVEFLGLRDTQVVEIPENLQVQRLDLSCTQVTEIPENKGAIQTIWIDSTQTPLKASAEALNIEVIIRE